jgi:ATP-binding cassette subfamily B multidrug efflux pump
MAPPKTRDHLNETSAALRPRHPAMPGRIEKATDPFEALNRLWQFLRIYRSRLILVIFIIGVSTLLGLSGPYLLSRAIDQFIANKDVPGLIRISLLMLIAYILTNLTQVMANRIMARISQNALMQLRDDLFGHIQKLPIQFFDRHPVGEMMSFLTNDIDAINQWVSQSGITTLASLLSMAGILVAMLILNLWLSIATLIVVPIMLWFTEFVARYTRRGYRDLQNELGSLNSIMQESLNGLRVIKAFQRGDMVAETFQTYNQAVYQTGVRANSYALLLMPITSVLGNLFVVVLAGLGGWLAILNLVTVGTIAAFITYGQNFIQPLRQIGNMYNTMQAALAGAERIFNILDEPVEPIEEESEPGCDLQGDVRFDQVCFSYKNGVPVIKDFSLETSRGEMVAIVGPTGAGKTTLINLLARFYKINSGKITIDGKDIYQIPVSALRRQLGIVLQDTILFSDTVMENIRFGRLDATDGECIRAAELADADHFIRHLPQGYQTILSDRAGNLSQGQRQMLSIARAALADPHILILDEATSSVDTRTEARIQAALLRLMKGRTSFVIAHRLRTIQDADQVWVIDEGEVIEKGTHQFLLDKKGFYYDLYISQFKGQSI